MPFKISAADRAELARWLRRKTLSQQLGFRARLILLLDQGQSVSEVARKLEATRKTVHDWRARYLSEGLAGLQTKPRPGRPTVLSDKVVDRILSLTMSELPQESTHWSVRLMAEYAGVTTWQVRQVWAAANLKPHRTKSFKVSRDPHFAEKVIDVVGLYINPPANALVLSVDEKTQIQALDRTQPRLPLAPGQVERRTHDYKRHGTVDLYAAFNIADGQVLTRITKRHRAQEFLQFLRTIDRQTDKQLDLHLILDNSSSHKTAAITEWLAKHPRFKLHFTPTSASWLNAVESWFSQLERRALERGIFTSVKELKTELKRFAAAHNKYSAKPFRWTKSAATIINAVERAKHVLPN